jgi:hypothetical protein
MTLRLRPGPALRHVAAGAVAVANSDFVSIAHRCYRGYTVSALPRIINNRDPQTRFQSVLIAVCFVDSSLTFWDLTICYNAERGYLQAFKAISSIHVPLLHFRN